MRVALDFRCIPYSGIWNYSYHLMEKLRDAGEDVRPVHLPSHLVCASSLGSVQGLRRLTWENSALPMNFRRLGIDLFHCTNNFGIPFLLPCPSVLTVHDFIPLTLSEVYLPSFNKRLAYKTLLSHSIRAATRIITISDFTRGELLRRFPGVGEKTRRIYHGCGKQYRRVEDSAALERTRAKYQLPEHFVLTMGGTQPRKNVASVVEIFRDRWKQGYKTPTLVIIGEIWRGCGPEQWDLTPNILFLGQVTEEELIYLYNICQLFLFPSLLEGFGLPVLEAMGCGAPVLAMRSSSIPEVTGEAALLVEPGSSRELARSLERLLADEPLRFELKARGQEQAAKFTWDKTAAETMAVYREAVATG